MSRIILALADETRPTVDTATAAHYLNYAPSTLRVWSHKGTGPLQPLRVPGMWKLQWRMDEIRAILGVSKPT